MLPQPSIIITPPLSDPVENHGFDPFSAPLIPQLSVLIATSGLWFAFPAEEPAVVPETVDSNNDQSLTGRAFSPSQGEMSKE